MAIEISDAEYQIMLIVWQENPVTSREINSQLTNDWHPKTVNTLLGRLVKKGALGFEKQGRKHSYIPLIEKDSYVKSKSAHFLQKLFNGQLSPMFTSFVNQGLVEKNDIQTLKTLIEEWEKKND